MKKILLFTFFVFVHWFGYAQQNTIIIIADDLGTDYLGFYPNDGDTANTPVLRSLLDEGVLFSNAWSNPVCSPTRAGLFTGRYSFRTGMGYIVSGTSSPQLDTAEMSVARLLRDFAPVKYATANVGKWHLHTTMPPAKRVFPNYMGYDLYSGNFNGAITDFYQWTRIKNGVLDTVSTYATTQNINDAIDWLDTLSANNPFFLWVAFNAPHTPHHKPPDSLISTPGLPGTPGHINANPSLYFKAAIEALDTEVGRLFQYLDQNNLRDSTNIIFIGDNGQEKSVAKIQDTTHVKGTLYDYGIHVPMIISGPAVVNPNRSSAALVNTVDLFATMLEMGGFNNWLNFIPPAKLPVDAVSLMPLLKNDTTAVRNWIFSEQFQPVSNLKDGKTIRNIDYKLIDFDNGTQRFYNLTLDPLEQVDLLSQTLMTFNDTLNYNELCNALNTLVGSPLCSLQTTSTLESLNPHNSVLLVPNPANDEVQVVLEDMNQLSSVHVTDVSGRTIHISTIGSIDTKHFHDGIYHLHISTLKGIFHRQLIVRH
jgi:arylsulfatase B